MPAGHHRSTPSSGSAPMGLGWDSEAQTVVVELLAVSDTEFDASVVLDDAEDGPDAVRVFLTPESACGRDPLQPGHLGGPPAGATSPSIREGHVCRAHQRLSAQPRRSRR